MMRFGLAGSSCAISRIDQELVPEPLYGYLVCPLMVSCSEQRSICGEARLTFW